MAAVPLGPGRAGILVDLGHPPGGWVDVLHLPDDPTGWPAVGVAGLFEVLQHRLGEVRLLPLDAGMRGRRTRYSRWSGQEWAAITRRYPEGSTVTGVVTGVFRSNREFTITFEDCWSTREYDDVEPVVGSTGALRVLRHLEWTHRILLTPDLAAETQLAADPVTPTGRPDGRCSLGFASLRTVGDRYLGDATRWNAATACGTVTRDSGQAGHER